MKSFQRFSSTIRQDLILCAQGLDQSLLSTPLYEDKATLDASDERLNTYIERHGSWLVWQKQAFVKKYQKLARFIKPGLLTQMFARSDTSKTGGPFTYVLGFRKAGKAVVVIVNHIRRFGGALFSFILYAGQGTTAIERAGGDSLGFTYTAARLLSRLQQSHSLPPSDPVYQIASNIGFTNQGAGLYEPRVEIARNLTRHITTALADRMELAGIFPDHTFIPQKSIFTQPMKDTLKELTDRMIDLYSDFVSAAVPDDGPTSVMDRMSWITANPMMMALANVTSRAASKKKDRDERGPPRSAQRAIGTVLWDRSSGILLAGFYSVGTMLQEIATQCAQGKLQQDDITNFMQDRFWKNFLRRSLLIVQQTNIGHGLCRLQATDITPAQLAVIGASVRTDGKVFDYTEKYYCTPEGEARSVSPELACLARIYVERNRLVHWIEEFLKPPASRVLPNTTQAANTIVSTYGFFKPALSDRIFESFPTLRVTAPWVKKSAPVADLITACEDMLNANTMPWPEKTLRHLVAAARAQAENHGPTLLLQFGGERCGRTAEQGAPKLNL